MSYHEETNWRAIEIEEKSTCKEAIVEIKKYQLPAQENPLNSNKTSNSIKGENKLSNDIILDNERSSIASLEYTNSELTLKEDTTSFRLSNTVTGRFPRLSGSSISMLESPSKDAKKSFGEYAECMESPRFSYFATSPHKYFGNTPITSPKQSKFSIQEVKGYLIDGEAKENYCEVSPFEKENSKKNRNMDVKIISFQDSDSKSRSTEIGLSNEYRQKTIFEEKKFSCHCHSCGIY